MPIVNGKNIWRHAGTEHWQITGEGEFDSLAQAQAYAAVGNAELSQPQAERILAVMSQKTDFVTAARKLATQLISIRDQAHALSRTYASRGYAPGDTDPITDDDIAASGVTAAQVQALACPGWLLTRLDALFSEQAVVGTIEGDAICDRLRNDL